MRKLHAVLRRIEGWVLAIAMIVMAVATIVNVFSRNLTGNTIAATEELNQFLIVLVCFVGLSYAAGEGRHIRMTALSDALPLRARRWLMGVVCGSTALLLLALAWYAAQYALSVDRRSPVLGVPLGWVYLVAPFVDPIVVILILTPIFAPAAARAGVDPVLVGTVVTMQVAIGSATPPFGCDIFTAIAIFRRPYLEILRGTPPFLLILLASSMMVILVPEIALYLRDLAFR